MPRHIDITDADIAVVHQVHSVLLAAMHVPADRLEHLVQLAHESSDRQDRPPRELFTDEGLTRQALRMFWHFRCNLEAVLPPEDGR